MIYLDNASTSFPKPESVYVTHDRFMREIGANPGRAGHRRAIEAERIVDRARRDLARLLGAPSSERIVFTLNATDALNIALKGYLRPGDHVVTSDLEHNSIRRPLNAMQSRGTITLTRVTTRGGFIDPADVRKAMRPDTRLVAVTHGSNVFGTIQPVETIARIAHESGAKILVDAAQTAGVGPLDIAATGLDMVAFAGHKSLLGPPGTGALVLADDVDLAPWREGGTGTDSSSPLHPDGYPVRLEGGTPNMAGIAALAEGVRYIAERTPERIREHEAGLAGLLRELLAADTRFILHGPADLSGQLGIVSFTVPGFTPGEFGAVLDESFDIAVRPGLHCAPDAHRSAGTWPDGTVRASVGPFNTEAEIRQAAGAMLEIAAAS